MIPNINPMIPNINQISNKEGQGNRLLKFVNNIVLPLFASATKNIIGIKINILIRAITQIILNRIPTVPTVFF